MPTLFLSYSQVDKDFAQWLLKKLHDAGVSVWMDSMKIRLGESLSARIGNAIDLCDYIGYIHSKNSVQSEWVRKELDVALGREVKLRRNIIIPIVLDETELPPLLRGRLFADFSKSSCYESSLKALVKRVAPKNTYGLLTGISHKYRYSHNMLTLAAPSIYRDGGRNLRQVSRDMGAPYQTVRRHLQDLSSIGISIVPVVNSMNIGLRRFAVSFDLSDDIENPKPLLGGLHQTAGLRNYSRDLLTGKINCEFLVPSNHVSEFHRALSGLSELDLIDSFSADEIIWKEILEMKTEFFDYEAHEWDVDYTRLVGNPLINVPNCLDDDVTPSLYATSPGVDYTDLLIIKSLELDPWIRVSEIAKMIQVSDRDIAYHLNHHVLGRKQIAGYRLRWVGTKEAWSKHSIILLSFIFNKISKEEARHAVSILSSVPFTWSHTMTRSGTYVADILIPLAHYPETLQYISSRLRAMKLKSSLAIEKDWSLTSSFTIPYTLYNIDRSDWECDAEHALGYTLQMIKQYGKKHVGV